MSPIQTTWRPRQTPHGLVLSVHEGGALVGKQRTRGEVTPLHGANGQKKNGERFSDIRCTHVMEERVDGHRHRLGGFGLGLGLGRPCREQSTDCSDGPAVLCSPLPEVVRRCKRPKTRPRISAPPSHTKPRGPHTQLARKQARVISYRGGS